MDWTSKASRLPLCREPWENYYILRRGIVPCCYGQESIAPMSDWEKAWNSSQLQKIRWYLSRGKLSPYCLNSPSCPIVQRFFEEKGENRVVTSLKQRPTVLRVLNRMFFRIPGKILRKFGMKF